MNKDVTEIEFTDVHNTQIVTSSLVDPMTPAPEFSNAFARLKTLANEMTDGWFKSEAVKKFSVNKIGYKKSNNGAMGCYLHCTVEFEKSNRPLNLNTQVKYALLEGAEESDFCLSGRAVDLLNELQRLAKDFMNGVRAQAALDLVPDAPQLAAPEKKVLVSGTTQRLRKNRKTCYDCNEPSEMVVDGVGYCVEHAKIKLTE